MDSSCFHKNFQVFKNTSLCDDLDCFWSRAHLIRWPILLILLAPRWLPGAVPCALGRACGRRGPGLARGDVLALPQAADFAPGPDRSSPSDTHCLRRCSPPEQTTHLSSVRGRVRIAVAGDAFGVRAFVICVSKPFVPSGLCSSCFLVSSLPATLSVWSPFVFHEGYLEWILFS